jgi:hypothetical protein
MSLLLIALSPVLYLGHNGGSGKAQVTMLSTADSLKLDKWHCYYYTILQ